MRAIPTRSVIGAVRCPVLVLAREDGPVCPLPVVEELAGRLLAKTTRFVRLPGAGHAVFRDRPDLVFPAVKSFVSQVGESQPAILGQEDWTTARQIPQTVANPATGTRGRTRGFTERDRTGQCSDRAIVVQVGVQIASRLFR